MLGLLAQWEEEEEEEAGQEEVDLPRPLRGVVERRDRVSRFHSAETETTDSQLKE